MADCLEGTWHDRLADRVTGQLSPADARAVDAHVAACGACGDELQLLQMVHAARPRITTPPVEAIVARLPRPKPADRAEPVEQRQSASIVSLAEARARRVPDTPLSRGVLRLAASALLVVGVGSAYLLSAPSVPATRGDGAVAVVESIAGGASDATAAVSLSYGGAWDLTEAEMQEVLASLEGWDGAPSTEIATTSLVLASGGDQ